MNISITTFVLSLLASLAIGCLIGYLLHSGLKNFNNRLKALASCFRYKLVDYWFVLILTVATIFVLVHFKECVSFSFTADFNGMNLIFLVWIALLIFPMFESFEGFGISIKKRKLDKEKESLMADYHAQIKNVQARKEAEHE